GDGSGPGSRSDRGATGDHGLVNKVSPWSVDDTVARLSAILAARGMKVFAAIDLGDEARRAGIELRDTRLFLVGSSEAAAAAIIAAPLAALDVPFRILVWFDGCQTRIGYAAPVEIGRRHDLPDEVAAALTAIDVVTSAVVDR